MSRNPDCVNGHVAPTPTLTGDGLCRDCANARQLEREKPNYPQAMSRVAWVPPGPNAASRCHCGNWFNAAWYAECESCRTALSQAIQAVRQVFPTARVIAAPGIPQTTGTVPVEKGTQP